MLLFHTSFISCAPFTLYGWFSVVLPLLCLRLDVCFYFLVSTPTTRIKKGFRCRLFSALLPWTVSTSSNGSVCKVYFISFFSFCLFSRLLGVLIQVVIHQISRKWKILRRFFCAVLSRPTAVTTHRDKNGTRLWTLLKYFLLEALKNGSGYISTLLAHSFTACCQRDELRKKVQNWIKLSSRLKCEPERNEKSADENFPLSSFYPSALRNRNWRFYCITNYMTQKLPSHPISSLSMSLMNRVVVWNLSLSPQPKPKCFLFSLFR